MREDFDIKSDDDFNSLIEEYHECLSSWFSSGRKEGSELHLKVLELAKQIDEIIRPIDEERLASITRRIGMKVLRRDD